RCTVLRKGKYIGTIEVGETSKEEMSEMMVGRKVNFNVNKEMAKPTDVVLSVQHLCVGKKDHKDVVNDVNFEVRKGEIVCIAGIDGNGQSELVYALSGLMPVKEGTILLDNQDITHTSIFTRNVAGLGHIPEDRHRYGLVLDYPLSYNMALKSYFKKEFNNHGFLDYKKMTEYSDHLIQKFDVRSGQGSKTIARSMSGGNQQKAIIAREVDNDPKLLIAVQPTRGLDVGAIEFIHSELVAERDKGRAILLISLELDEVMNLADRILVIYEGEIVAELNPEKTTIQELGLYMAGSKKEGVK
ncbi:ABC transporter ATP-binding protein, partial [Coprobacillus cateniformis]